MFVFSVCCLVSRQCHTISPITRSSDSSVLASSRQTLSPSALFDLTRLDSLQDGAVVPLAYMILCVRFTPVVHACGSLPTITALSARGATRDTGGWLALTRPGLAPGKKRRALLGALVVVVIEMPPADRGTARRVIASHQRLSAYISLPLEARQRARQRLVRFANQRQP